MDLNAIASNAIGDVNPNYPAQLQTSSGQTTLPSGRRTPLFDPIAEISVQVQPISTSDIIKTEGLNRRGETQGLNLQGVTRHIWVSGEVDVIIRVNKKGGDIITIPDGPWKGVWLTNVVVEQWPDWVSVIATLQNEDIPNG